jgi:eukaryotic-like serine/threonine-protein kinase
MQRTPIDPTHWAELSRLLDEALELPPAGREFWLATLAPAYEPLKPQLRDLLSRAARIETRDFLNTLPKLADATAESTVPAEQAGECIGSYRLVREIGAGGMGSVWLAERTDGLIRRPVALKLPHIGSTRIGLAARMAREREILATLTHPNIARLYDAGITKEGRPYLALEYIEGRPIDAYCNEQRLGLHARLRLFLQVAHAVAHAHAKLIIHRDLKPANILVAGDEEVRLLDFGVAKLLEEGKAAATQLTEISGRALTLDYASPEQILGESLTTATDVYSLGVVLYELLAGTRPYHVQRGSRGALEDAIVQMDPKRMSELASAPERRALRGDLDTIVEKALRKRPDERYATVNAFAEDVLAFLERRPIQARPAGFWYRTARFIARRKLVVALSTTALAAIIGGAGVALWQMLEATTQRDAALAQQQRAESFSEFMTVLLQDAGARPLTAPELLRRGTQILENQTGMDESLLAHMYYEISRNYLFFNDTESELALLKRSADLARRKADTDIQAGAECAMAWSLVRRDRAAAEATFARAEQIVSSVRSPSLQTFVDCQRARASLLTSQGDIEGAIAALQKGFERFERQGAHWSIRKRLLTTQLTDIYRMQDRFKDALPYSEEELRFIRASGRAGTMLEIAAMNNHAGNLTQVGETAQSALLMEEILKRLESGAHWVVQPVGFRTNYGTTKWRLGDPASALELADTDRRLAEQVGNRTSVALSDLLAARALLALGRKEESLQRLERAEALWKTDSKMFARMLQEAALHRADLHIASGELDQARALVDATLAAAGFPGKNAPGIYRVLRTASRAYRLSGDPQRAVELAGAALDISRSIARTERRSVDVGLAALLRAEALADQGITERAASDAALAAEALRAGFGPRHTDTLAAEELLKRLPR